MQRSLSPGLQAEGIKPMFQRRGRRSSNVNNGEGLLCVFKASKPPQPCETPKTRRHTPTLRAASPPLRSFDHAEPFMRNDWRTNPLLSRQIYLTERERERGRLGGGLRGRWWGESAAFISSCLHTRGGTR